MSYRAGFIGVIGLPNAGKSTLVNSLTGEKVSITSRKPQTTRQRIMGIVNEKEAQYVFVDAPGVIEKQKGLNLFLEQEWKSVISDSDVLLVVLNIDAPRLESLEHILELAVNSEKPTVCLINKTDLDIPLRAEKLKSILEEKGLPYVIGAGRKPSSRVKESLLPLLKERLPEAKEALYDVELFTPHNVRDILREIVREKCFEYLHEEIPYGLAVQVRKYDESGRVAKVSMDILVAKESYISIVVGEGGQTLKRIGMHARKEAENQLRQRFHFELYVRYRKSWADDPITMKELGYVVPQS